MPFSGGSGGTGTALDPYQIANITDLKSWNDNWDGVNALGLPIADKYFKITADIDASTSSTWNESGGLYYGWRPIGSATIPFTGGLDGNNKYIRGITCDRNISCVGFFGYVSTTGEIKDLTLNDLNIAGGSQVGGLVGWFYAGTITTCKTYGTVKCYGVLTQTSDCGGLVGYLEYASIDHCSSSCTVTLDNQWHVGGFCGRASNSSIISKCYADGDVYGNITNKVNNVGGFCGWLALSATLSNCYSRGVVSGYTRVGGFLGGHSNGTAEYCYSAGAVYGQTSSVGGFCGFHLTTVTPVTTGCFWDTETSGQSTSSCGTGKTTTQMQTLATFTAASWNFSDPWDINVATPSYPYFGTHTMTSVSPNSGTEDGGTAVIIVGTGFGMGNPSITFDLLAATGETSLSDTQASCATPAHAAGAVDVVVTLADGQAITMAAAYTYNASPPEPTTHYHPILYTVDHLVSSDQALTFEDTANILRLDGSFLLTGSLTLAHIDNAVLYFDTAGVITCDADLTFDGTNLTCGGLITGNTMKITTHTDNAVLYSGTAGEVSSSANLTFDGTSLILSDAKTLIVKSAGSDKYITISHNDTNGLITSSDGTISFDNENVTTTGLITASDGVSINVDSKKLLIGALATGDLQLYHDGTNSYIYNDTGILKIQDAGSGIQIGTATTELLGFYGVAAVNQPDTVADAATQDLTGTDTVDKTKLQADLTSCKNAINAVIDRLQELGLVA